jgi:hypothetical protein
MKLNQRDKIILIGVLVVLIWIAGIMLFIKPAISDVSSASKELDAKEMELSSLQAQIKQDENLPQEVDDAYDEATEIASVFYSKRQQDAAMTEVQSQIDGTSDDTKITNTNLYITEMFSNTLERYEYTESSDRTALDDIIDGTADSSSTSTVAVTSTQVNDYTMSFDFECTKKNLLTFIQNIQTNSQKSLVISELTINDVLENEDDTEITGSMSLDFMMLRELQDPDTLDDDTTETVNASEE